MAPALSLAADTSEPAPTTAAGAWALDVLRDEATAIESIINNPPPKLAEAIANVAEATTPVLCCGVGKSGLVAAKVAATLSSLGTPAFVLSAGDAAHGDLGSVVPGSTVLLFSNSGTTAEILRIVPGLRARKCHLIGLVGRAASPLGRMIDTLVALPVAREADHIGMAPTASTTLQMAMGDAIAVAASRLRGFTREDFLQCHPAGQLGQHALPVTSLMRSGDAMPVVMPHMTLAETVSVMSAGLMGAACVIDHEERLLGIIVDGDVRRAVQARTDLYSVPASAVMQTDPITLSASASIGDALELMREHGSGLLVLPITENSGRLAGMVHSIDLVQNL